MTPRDPEDRHGAMVASLPALRAFARALTGARDSADDLVRSAITRGLAPGRHAPPAVDGTVWLLAILHDLYQDIAAPVTAPRTAADDAFGDAFWQLQDDERGALVLTVRRSSVCLRLQRKHDRRAGDAGPARAAARAADTGRPGRATDGAGLG